MSVKPAMASENFNVPRQRANQSANVNPVRQQAAPAPRAKKNQNTPAFQMLVNSLAVGKYGDYVAYNAKTYDEEARLRAQTNEFLTGNMVVAAFNQSSGKTTSKPGDNLNFTA
ncbi:MAG: hypothetical protein KC474_09900 [Cyanobacteria bacterium HKST-UBA04]|nr:hypothetical protein [Cyanobacteria bacterium HKST-UBA04]MCA9842865.1 hypothetical protein [Cyanobacteria bacterium HKST-UBA03]